jgi:hypothetical protein
MAGGQRCSNRKKDFGKRAACLAFAQLVGAVTEQMLPAISEFKLVLVVDNLTPRYTKVHQIKQGTREIAAALNIYWMTFHLTQIVPPLVSSSVAVPWKGSLEG